MQPRHSVSTNTGDVEKQLNALVECNTDDKSNSWNCHAVVQFRLLHQNDNAFDCITTV